MKKTIFSKIFLGYFLIAISLSVAVIIISFRVLKDNYIKLSASNLINISAALERDVRQMAVSGKKRELEKFVKSTAKKINTRITVIDGKGVVVADSEEDPLRMGNHIARPEIAAALKGENGRSLRYSNTVNKYMLYTAVPIKGGGQTWVLRLSLFLEDINSFLRGLVGRIAGITAIILALALLGAYFLSKRISFPVKELGRAAEKVAGHDFDVSVSIKTDDELKYMADSFNYMTGEIKKLFETISAQKEELNTIISSVSEALLVVDQDEKIVLCNESFKKITGTGCGEKKFFWECVLPPGFNELIEKSGRKEENISGQVEISGRVYICSITFLPGRKERVVILHDVTGIKEFENIKKDFVANVSHELKTPLTAIKGFTETLESEITDTDNTHYLDIIKKHTERLINIVEDLLLLSNLEKRGGEEDFEKVNLVDILRNSVKIFEQKIKKKKLTIDFKTGEDIPAIKGDSFKLEQLFINLIDNAVKYTDSGGITVLAEEEGGGARVVIRDTGVGIPGEHMPRIFERFYVTDKSRSRKMGGTGLGLSIVKHIVLMHKADIEVKSVPSGGTEFIIMFPPYSS